MSLQRIDLVAHDRRWSIDVDTDGIIGSRIAASGKPYEAPLLEWIYEKNLSGIAIDAGAHVGNHTLWLAAVCGLEVWAFEPLTCDELLRNVALNDLAGRVHVNCCALGAEFGFAYQIAPGTLTTTMPALEPDELQSERTAVPVRPLDTYELSGVSIMKIDVEDMEPFVLAGAAQTIARSRPIICAEARDRQCHRRIAAILEPLGYERTQHFLRGTPLGCWEPTT